jgi:hypothetical protein
MGLTKSGYLENLPKRISAHFLLSLAVELYQNPIKKPEAVSASGLIMTHHRSIHRQTAPEKAKIKI